MWMAFKLIPIFRALGLTLRQCAWCGKPYGIKRVPGLGLTHGACKSCLEKQYEEVRKMKKQGLLVGMLSAIVVGCLLVLAVRGFAAAPVPQVGDANGDSVINILDVTATERMILGYDPVKSWADADWSGTVDMGDVVRIERIILGLDTPVRP